MAGENSVADKRNPVHRLYDTCMDWISGPYGGVGIVFYRLYRIFLSPPPDIFLIAMCVAIPLKAFRYAAICSIGSVLGGGFGYGLGYWFMDSVGLPIVEWYGFYDKYELVQHYFKEYDVWIVGTAGFTPIPYKLFTITAGFVQSNFITFMLVSLFARSARFFFW